eukprot:644986-Prorocentrum_lima.AAC.1
MFARGRFQAVAFVTMARCGVSVNEHPMHVCGRPGRGGWKKAGPCICGWMTIFVVFDAKSSGMSPLPPSHIKPQTICFSVTGRHGSHSRGVEGGT